MEVKIPYKALFKGCKIPKRKADFVSDSGSRYWFGCNKRGKYIIRCSDHWVSYKINDKVIKQLNKIKFSVWKLKTNNYDVLNEIKRSYMVQNPSFYSRYEKIETSSCGKLYI